MAPEQQLLVRGVTRLQACVRGYLVRKRFQSLQEEYQNMVNEIEGDLGQLQWKGHFIPTPVFPQKKQMKVKQLIDQEPRSKDQNNRDKGQQKLCPLETIEPEKDCNSRSYMKPTAQLQSEEMVLRGEDSNVKQGPECEADKSTEQNCSLSGENTEWKNYSNATSVWSSTVLETGSTAASQVGSRLVSKVLFLMYQTQNKEPLMEPEINDTMDLPSFASKLPFKSIQQELPQTLPDLQCYRNHLAMELLWLQQAIVSRKKYLILKQRLGTPE